MTNLDENKKYYLMGLREQWYAVALEDYQVTFLQQYIKASAFNIPLNGEKIKQAKKEIIIYDFTNLDDDELIHIFFERQKPYQEKKHEYTPEHLEQKNCDDRNLQDNEEFKKMSPYNFSKKKNDNIYYIMKITKRWHAIALENHQVKLLKNYIDNKMFSYPVDFEKLQTATKEIIECDFSKLDNEKLLNYFANLARRKSKNIA